MIQHDVLASKSTEEEQRKYDITLRPHTFEEYVGQEEIKKNLKIALQAAKKRNEALEHILLHGPAGLGKTTLAYIIARETGATIKVTSGPALERSGDLAAILTNLKNKDILFIDEIHRLKSIVEEVLYTAMEDFGIDLVIGKGPSARSVRLNLPRFTLIGATTKVSLLSSPLRDRFGQVFKFNFYEIEDIKRIILRSAKILNCAITDEASLRLAQSSRRTPRIANRLLRRTRDYTEVNGFTTIEKSSVEKTMQSLGIDELGLDEMDRQILRLVIEKFKGGPVGLNTIASALSEEEATIEDIYEPYLLQLGFLERTQRGRIATEHAYNHLKLKSQTLI